MEFDLPLMQRLVFRWIRQSKGYSIENVACAIPISKSSLSNMENGKRTFSPFVFEKGLLHMNSHFEILEPDKREEILDMIANFIQGMYYLDSRQKQAVRQRFAKWHFDAIKDFCDGYFYLVFLDILIKLDQMPLNMATETLQEPLIHRLRCLERMIMDCPSDLQTIYALAVLMWLTRSRQWQTSQRFFNTLNLNEEMSRFPGLISLVAYYQIKALVVCPDSRVEVRELLHRLQSVAHRQHNYLRLMYLDFDEGIYLMSIGNYKQARKLFHQLQRTIFPFELGHLPQAIQDNLIWCYLMAQDFQQSLQEAYALEAKFGVSTNSNLVFQVYCFYRLGQIQKGKEALFHLEHSLANSSSDLEILKIFEPLLDLAEKKKEEQDPFLKLFCTRCENLWRKQLTTLPATRELAIFFLRIQLYEMERIEKYSEANRLCRILDTLRQTRPKIDHLPLATTNSSKDVDFPLFSLS